MQEDFPVISYRKQQGGTLVLACEERFFRDLSSRRAAICNSPKDDGIDMAGQPSFLITIDTEGDNLWSRPRVITTRNAAFLPRFQALCEKFGLKPTYLTNYEMAISQEFVEFGRDSLRGGAAEIGRSLTVRHSESAGLQFTSFCLEPSVSFLSVQ